MNNNKNIIVDIEKISQEIITLIKQNNVSVECFNDIIIRIQEIYNAEAKL